MITLLKALVGHKTINLKKIKMSYLDATNDLYKNTLTQMLDYAVLL
jgi:hypothetical protein